MNNEMRITNGETLTYAVKFSKTNPDHPISIYLKTFQILHELENKLFPRGNTDYSASEEFLWEVVWRLNTLLHFAVEDNLKEANKNE